MSVRGWGPLPECCDRGVWGQVGWTGRATEVDGLKRGVRGVCTGAGPAARTLRSWHLGAGGVDQARSVGGRRKKRSVRCQ